MKKVKFLSLAALAVFALASCKSKMTDEQVAQEAQKQFDTKKAELDAAAEQTCNDAFSVMVDNFATEMSNAKIAELEAAAAPAPTK